MDARTRFLSGKSRFTLTCPLCGKEHVVAHRFWHKIDHYVDECFPLIFNCEFSRGGKIFPKGKIIFNAENVEFLVFKIIPQKPLFKDVHRAIYWHSVVFDPIKKIAVFEEPIQFKPQTASILRSMPYLRTKVEEHGSKNPHDKFSLRFSLKID